MKPCKRNFPGVDGETSDRMSCDVEADEQGIVEAISNIRQSAHVSLEAIGYLLGSDPSLISRCLNGTSTATLTTYLRIARALGYRSKITFEQVKGDLATDPLAQVKTTAHRVRHRKY